MGILSYALLVKTPLNGMGYLYMTGRSTPPVTARSRISEYSTCVHLEEGCWRDPELQPQQVLMDML